MKWETPVAIDVRFGFELFNGPKKPDLGCPVFLYLNS